MLTTKEIFIFLTIFVGLLIVLISIKKTAESNTELVKPISQQPRKRNGQYDSYKNQVRWMSELTGNV